MDIKKYTGYFHDRTVLDVKHQENQIIFLLESLVVGVDEREIKMALSQSNALKGRLIVSGIRKIRLEGREYEGHLKKSYDNGEILDLKISDNYVFLVIEWTDYPPKPRKSDCTMIEIEAEKIEWITEK